MTPSPEALKRAEKIYAQIDADNPLGLDEIKQAIAAALDEYAAEWANEIVAEKMAIPLDEVHKERLAYEEKARAEGRREGMYEAAKIVEDQIVWTSAMVELLVQRIRAAAQGEEKS